MAFDRITPGFVSPREASLLSGVARAAGGLAESGVSGGATRFAGVNQQFLQILDADPAADPEPYTLLDSCLATGDECAPGDFTGLINTYRLADGSIVCVDKPAGTCCDEWWCTASGVVAHPVADRDDPPEGVVSGPYPTEELAAAACPAVLYACEGQTIGLPATVTPTVSNGDYLDPEYEESVTICQDPTPEGLTAYAYTGLEGDFTRINELGFTLKVACNVAPYEGAPSPPGGSPYLLSLATTDTAGTALSGLGDWTAWNEDSFAGFYKYVSQTEFEGGALYGPVGRFDGTGVGEFDIGLTP